MKFIYTNLLLQPPWLMLPHTHMNSKIYTCDLSLLFWFVFFPCNLHLWFFHHRNVRRPHTLKKQNVVASKSLSHMKTRNPCAMVLLFSYLQIAKWYTCTNKTKMLGLSSLLPNHKIMERQEDKIKIQDMGSKFNNY